MPTGKEQQPGRNPLRLAQNVAQLTVLSFGALFVIAGWDSAHAQAVDFDSTRINVAGDKFSGTVQTAVTFHMAGRKILRASHIELAVGALHSSDHTRAFVSLGPVWHWPIRSSRTFLELGFSPTLLGGSTFNGRDLGGNFHFTSSATVGAHFGNEGRSTLALRVQHISNGGLHSTNPGMDSVGLSFSHEFDQ